MNSTSLSSERNQRIVDLVRAGTLPRTGVDRTWGGGGTGRACVACNEPIARNDLEIEVDLLSGRTLCFDVDCFMEWWAITQRPRGRVAI
jgi:hypothetical protein